MPQNSHPSRKVVDLRPKPMVESPRSVPVRSAEPMPPEPPVKRVPLRERRRRARAITAAAVLILIAGIAYGAHYVSYLPQYNISSVQVTGTRVLAPKAIEDYILTQMHSAPAAFLSPTNVLTFDGAALEESIVKFYPRVQQVSIRRDSPLSTAVDVEIVERDAFAQWCGPDASCYLMDNTGYLFDAATASTTLEQTYVFKNGIDASSTPIGQTYADGHFPNIAALLTQLAHAGYMPLSAAVDNDRDFSVQLQPGFYIRASYGVDSESLVRNLKLVLSSEALASQESDIEYIDLRFGDRVYYKLKSAAEAQPAREAEAPSQSTLASAATTTPATERPRATTTPQKSR